MSLIEIKKIFEQRKFNLARVLENGRDDIELSKQHQMYGAIKEIDNILRTIDHFHETQIEEEFDFRLSNEQNKTIMQRINLKFKAKKMKIKNCFLMNKPSFFHTHKYTSFAVFYLLMNHYSFVKIDKIPKFCILQLFLK